MPRGGGGGAQPREEHQAQGMGMLPQPGGPMQRQAMHPQRAGYMPSLLPPGTGYPDFTPMGETDEYLSWQMQQMQQQQIQRQMQEQHQAYR